ncbi:MAG: tetratricopeptide repeat protein [Polyangia bacterium]
MTTPTCSRPSTDSRSRRGSLWARGALAATALLLLTPPSIAPTLGEGTARAQDAEGFRARYDRGVALYNTGQYDRAIEEFRGAYELKQVPIILFSLAQAHRKAGHHKEAIELYDRFLATDPKEPIKTEAQKFLDESKAALQAQDEEKRKAEEKLAADKAAADKAAADKAAAELAVQQAAFRKKYGPGRPLNIAKWALGGAGLAAVVAGAVLMAFDGRPTCALAPGQKLCPEQLDTLLTGGVVLGGGVLLLGGSAALFVLDAKQMRDHAPRPTLTPAETPAATPTATPAATPAALFTVRY